MAGSAALPAFSVPAGLILGNHDLEGDEFETDEENLAAWQQTFGHKHYWAAGGCGSSLTRSCGIGSVAAAHTLPGAAARPACCTATTGSAAARCPQTWALRWPWASRPCASAPTFSPCTR